MPLKDCKYGPRVYGLCPPKPCAGGKPRGADGKCASKDCKYGPRVPGPRGAMVCPPKPLASGKARSRQEGNPLKQASIDRLFAMAGIKAKVSSLMYGEVYGLLMTFLRNVIQTASVITDYRKKKTITDGDVLVALDSMIKTLRVDAAIVPKSAGVSGLKTCAAKAKVTAASAGTCLAIPRATMDRLEKDVLHDINASQGLTPAARDMIHVLAEKKLVQMLKVADSQRAADQTAPTADDLVNHGYGLDWSAKEGWVLLPRHVKRSSTQNSTWFR